MRPSIVGPSELYGSSELSRQHTAPTVSAVGAVPGSGTLAAIGELLRREETQQVPRFVFPEQPLDARDLDGVDAAADRAAAVGRSSLLHVANQRAARSSSAAFVPANPRQRINATSLLGGCASVLTRTPSHALSATA